MPACKTRHFGRRSSRRLCRSQPRCPLRPAWQMRPRWAAARTRCQQPCCPAGAGRTLPRLCCPSLMGGLQAWPGLADIVFLCCFWGSSPHAVPAAMLSSERRLPTSILVLPIDDIQPSYRVWAPGTLPWVGEPCLISGKAAQTAAGGHAASPGMFWWRVAEENAENWSVPGRQCRLLSWLASHW